MDEKVRSVSQVRRVADLLDTRFKIPGTDIRFGLDVIIGLIPGLGDIVSYALSGGLLIAMVKNGASSKAIARMLINISMDTTIGAIPFFGDIFDLFFKANKRNVDIYEEHFEEGKYQGSVWPLVIGVIIILIALFVIMLYIIAQVVQWFFGFVM